MNPLRDREEAAPPIDQTYEVERPIALGGMGRVFAARHRKTGRVVAVKTLHERYRNRPDAVARLCREARMLGRVDHVHVVGVLDAGDCAIHGPYVVLELLEGRCLDGLIATRTSLAYPHVVRVMRSIAAALRAVHRVGIVHRDVKPGNIFVTTDQGAAECVKLLDFGIAAEGAAPVASGEPTTRDGELLGTLGYMSPEQLTHPSEVDGRADLFSLGVTALECLGAGRATDFALRARTRNLAAHLLEERADLPAAFVRILDGLLAADVNERCPTAQALVEQLEGLPHVSGDSILRYGELPGVAVVLATSTPRTAAPRPPRPYIAADNGRRLARAPYATPIRLTQGERTLDGQAEDISVGGLLITAVGEVEVGVPSVVRFNLPTTGGVVNVPACARWTRTDGKKQAIGIEFAFLDDAAREAIRTYVAWFAN